MQDALRQYLGLAMGLTDTSRKRVRKVVKEAVGRGNATADQVRAMTTDLLAANSTNRDALVKLVKFEVDRALGVVGLATAEEVADLTARLRALEGQLRSTETRPTTPAPRKRAGAAKALADQSAAPATLPESGPAPAGRTRRTAAAKSSPTKAATTAKATRAKATRAKATTAKATKAPATKATKAARTKATATKATTAKVTGTRATKTAGTKAAKATKATKTAGTKATGPKATRPRAKKTARTPAKATS